MPSVNQSSGYADAIRRWMNAQPLTDEEQALVAAAIRENAIEQFSRCVSEVVS